MIFKNYLFKILLGWTIFPIFCGSDKLLAVFEEEHFSKKGNLK